VTCAATGVEVAIEGCPPLTVAAVLVG